MSPTTHHEGRFFAGSFPDPIEPIGFTGAGALELGSGGLVLTGKARRRALAVTLGLLAGAVGVIATAILTVAFTHATGIDVMGHRRGPLLVGLIGFGVAYLCYRGASAAVDRLLSRPASITVALGDVCALGTGDGGVALVWREGERVRGVHLQIADAALAELRARLGRLPGPHELVTRADP